MKYAKSAGFTLVELLVVIAIIGTLVALLLPAIQSAREAARRSHCVNNLKQIAVAEQLHHDSYGKYTMGRETHWQQGVSWAFRLLPYMEMQNVHDSFQRKFPVFDQANALAMRTPVATFYCPTRREPAADRDFDNNDQPSLVEDVAAGGDYAANAGLDFMYGTSPETTPQNVDPGTVVGPMFTFSKVNARQITDGLSQTLVVGERAIPEGLESQPGLEDHDKGDNAFFAADNPRTILAGTRDGLSTGRHDPKSHVFGSEHSQIVHFAFLDGHVAAIDLAIDLVTLQRLSVIADGEIVSTDNL
jgi:prepilin-type N-terminal cleavage/methylation domain-containing protein/prepilin-type processing-associated H-X9-DG protein